MGELQAYSPGLEGVVAGVSAICGVDHDRGGLLYRGYPIEELATGATFEEVAYLLLIGELPDQTELEEFSSRLSENRTIPPALVEIFHTLPHSAHPMDLLRTGVSILALSDPDVADNSREANLRKAIRLIAQIPTIIASCYRIAQGKRPLDPDPGLSHVHNFLSMLTGEVPDEEVCRAMTVSLILYAEHEFNASTFSARVTASTLSDMYSAVTSAIGTLKGPLHGGANEAVMRMLLEIGEEERAEKWVMTALAQRKKIMGFGHRVYKRGDPRTPMIKAFSRRLGELRGEMRWYRISEVIEGIMEKEKGLFPNLDFYSASVYYLMGIPVELYTPIFVSSRVVGWAAHVIEQHEENRLIRPLSRYVGPPMRRYVPMSQRS